MTTIFNKIHRLKQQPGWTWEHFMQQIDRLDPFSIDEKTLFSHYRLPHKRPNSHLSQVINRLHDRCFPDPFPEPVNRLMRLYNHLLSCKKHLTLDQDILDLECYLMAQRERENESDLLWQARLDWLLGNIQFDRIANHRDNGRSKELAECKARAITYYQRSVEAIEQYNQTNPEQEVAPHHLYKAQHNILACYLNAVPASRRSEDPETLRYLQESNYIANSKQTLAAEPFQWGIARNGLRFASLLKNGDDVRYFFNALVEVSPRFLDPNYRPLKQKAIAEGPDFRWALENILTEDYIEQIGETKRRKR